MPTNEPPQQAESTPQSLFVTTRWTVVLTAKDKTSPECAQALETLCQAYWYPLYALVRGFGYSPPDAQDLTQSFFARLLEKDYLKVVERENGRFRAFLRMALKRFLANEWDRIRAEKRGGGQAPLPFDTTMAEERFRDERAESLSPDLIYDRRWALTLLNEATARLDAEYTNAGKGAELAVLKPHLTATRGEIPYEEIAKALQLTDGAARVSLHRLRKRFREIFRAVIAETVSEAGEIDGEVNYVLEVLSKA